MPIPTSPRELPILWGRSIGSMPIPTPPQGLPILWRGSIGSMSIPTPPRGGDQLGPCRSLHHPGSYQSPRGNQLDPCQSQHHPEVTNPLGAINWVYADPYITPGGYQSSGGNQLIHIDPNITLRLSIL
ncbi:hypothetical protein GBA52_004594 [Prunus armeniaca]|nr:hypothetical protein GBA52_004594 [Prunus armeniaca]